MFELKKITPEDVKPKLLRQKVAIVILTLTVIVPALFMSGFIDLGAEMQISKLIFTFVALVGGAIAGVLWQNDKKKFLAGTLAGIVTGLCVLWLAYFYFLPRQSFAKIEIAVPLLIGMLPGLFVYSLVRKFTDKTSVHEQV